MASKRNQHGRPGRENGAVSDEQRQQRPATDRPGHPNKQAAWLLVGVTLLIVLLAVLSTTGGF